jgi:predicted dehydrogenase
MDKEIKIGMVGLDTSHVVAFTKLLNDPKNEFHIPGGKVVAAFPGGSPDFDLSANRIEGFTKQLHDEFGVRIVDSVEAVAEECDAIMLESVDGRVHLPQFQILAPYGKPVFIDKPMTVSLRDAEAIVGLAKRHRVPLMSASSLRFAEPLQIALADETKGSIFGVDTYGPMAIVPTQPGYFWYGIHSIEMLFASMQGRPQQVSVTTNDDHDLITSVWDDGRIGTVRGNRKGNNGFGALIHRQKGTQYVDAKAAKPYYASILERIMKMFHGGESAVDVEESLAIIRFIEAANVSRTTGKAINFG